MPLCSRTLLRVLGRASTRWVVVRRLSLPATFSFADADANNNDLLADIFSRATPLPPPLPRPKRSPPRDLTRVAISSATWDELPVLAARRARSGLPMGRAVGGRDSSVLSRAAELWSAHADDVLLQAEPRCVGFYLYAVHLLTPRRRPLPISLKQWDAVCGRLLHQTLKPRHVLALLGGVYHTLFRLARQDDDQLRLEHVDKQLICHLYASLVSAGQVSTFWESAYWLAIDGAMRDGFPRLPAHLGLYGGDLGLALVRLPMDLGWLPDGDALLEQTVPFMSTCEFGAKTAFCLVYATAQLAHALHIEPTRLQQIQGCLKTFVERIVADPESVMGLSAAIAMPALQALVQWRLDSDELWHLVEASIQSDPSQQLSPHSHILQECFASSANVQGREMLHDTLQALISRSTPTVQALEHLAKIRHAGCSRVVRVSEMFAKSCLKNWTPNFLAGKVAAPKVCSVLYNATVLEAPISRELFHHAFTGVFDWSKCKAEHFHALILTLTAKGVQPPKDWWAGFSWHLAQTNLSDSQLYTIARDMVTLVKQSRLHGALATWQESVPFLLPAALYARMLQSAASPAQAASILQLASDQQLHVHASVLHELWLKVASESAEPALLFVALYCCAKLAHWPLDSNQSQLLELIEQLDEPCYQLSLLNLLNMLTGVFRVDLPEVHWKTVLQRVEQLAGPVATSPKAVRTLQATKVLFRDQKMLSPPLLARLREVDSKIPPKTRFLTDEINLLKTKFGAENVTVPYVVKELNMAVDAAINLSGQRKMQLIDKLPNRLRYFDVNEGEFVGDSSTAKLRQVLCQSAGYRFIYCNGDAFLSVIVK